MCVRDREYRKISCGHVSFILQTTCWKPKSTESITIKKNLVDAVYFWNRTPLQIFILVKLASGANNCLKYPYCSWKTPFNSPIIILLGIGGGWEGAAFFGMGSTIFLKSWKCHIFFFWSVEWDFLNWSLMQPTYFLFNFCENWWKKGGGGIWQHSNKWTNCLNENNWRYEHDFNLSIQIWRHFIFKVVKCWKHFNSATYFF